MWQFTPLDVAVCPPSVTVYPVSRHPLVSPSHYRAARQVTSGDADASVVVRCGDDERAAVNFVDATVRALIAPAVHLC
jgi:hypothetical protein